MTQPHQRNRRDSWKAAWATPSFRRQMLVTLPALILAFLIFARFILFIESRPGVVLHDPVLARLEPRDATWIIFAFIYGGVGLAVFYLLSHPRALLVALQAYVVMMVVRMIVMYLAPFDPPEGMIPLIDPFAAATTGATLTRDLFFSGHTASLFLFFLTARVRLVRWIFLFCAVATGALLMLQHVHYSLDVAAAPFFAYTSYRMAVLFESWYGERLEVKGW